MNICGRDFKTDGATYIMGILNMTPDSFSDGGSYRDDDAALYRAQEMIREGADIIDVGGESTRPGYTEVSALEEIERTAHIIERLRRELDIPVSIDTSKSEVALEAIKAGAGLINDVWGLARDEGMAPLIAEHDLPCCLMHNRETVADDLAGAMRSDIKALLDRADSAGISRDRIILDPGIGFAKTYEQNLQVLAHESFMLPEGYPVLIGASRKSVIGNTLELPPSDRVEGTLAISSLAAWRGVMFVRVHDIKENFRAVRMTEAIRRYG